MQPPDKDSRVSPPTREEKFLANLDTAIEFHRNNTNDPHNIGNAVMISLVETRDAYARAFGLTPLRPSHLVRPSK